MWSTHATCMPICMYSRAGPSRDGAALNAGRHLWCGTSVMQLLFQDTRAGTRRRTAAIPPKRDHYRSHRDACSVYVHLSHGSELGAWRPVAWGVQVIAGCKVQTPVAERGVCVDLPKLCQRVQRRCHVMISDVETPSHGHGWSSACSHSSSASTRTLMHWVMPTTHSVPGAPCVRMV